MSSRLAASLALLCACAALPRAAAAQDPHAHHPGHHAPRDAAARGDSAFAALQARGARVMGVDQYTSAHRFEDLPDGGRIVLTRDPADTAGVRAIREHLRAIAAAFARGDFTDPARTHDRPVPGTAALAARRAHVRYAFAERPGGGAVRITTRDAEALRAVRAFLAFQRDDHRAH